MPLKTVLAALSGSGLVALTLVASAGTSLPAFGAEPRLEELKRLSLEELLEVTAVSKTPEKASEAPAIVSVYTRADLDRLQPRNLIDLLELTVGFLVERDQDDIVFAGRGVITDNNQKFMVAIDGHRVSNNVNFGVNPFHKSRNLIAIAERIEIIRGPGGVLWGPDAFLGLINVVTRRAASEGSHGSAALAWNPGDDGRYASLGLLQELAPETHLAVFLDAESSRGEEVSTALRGHGGFDLDASTFWEGVEWPTHAFNGRLDRGASWLSGQILNGKYHIEGNRQRDDFRQLYIEAGHELRLGARHDLSVRLYGDHYRSFRADTVRSDDILFEFLELRLGAETLLESHWDERFSTVLGWDTRFHDYDGGRIGDVFRELSRNGHTTAVGRLQQNGLFGQVTGRFGDFLVHAAARFDGFDDDQGNLFIPRVSVGYRPNEHVTVKVLYTEGALRPSWSQLAAFFSVDSTDPAPNLKEEQSRTIETNVALNYERYASSISLYRTRVEDTINAVNGVDGFGFYNYADHETIGLEWENTLDVGERVRLFFNLTHFFKTTREELVELLAIVEPNELTERNSVFVIHGTDDPYNVPRVFLSAGATLTRELGAGSTTLAVTPIIRFKGNRTIQGVVGEAPDRDVSSLYVDLKAHLKLREHWGLSLVGLNVLDDQDPVGIGNGVAGFIIPKGATWELGLSGTF